MMPYGSSYGSMYGSNPIMGAASMIAGNYGQVWGSPAGMLSPNAQVRQEAMPTPAGMGNRTIVEEHFEIPNPPQVQTIKSYVPRQITIPQPPMAQLIE